MENFISPEAVKQFLVLLFTLSFYQSEANTMFINYRLKLNAKWQSLQLAFAGFALA